MDVCSVCHEASEDVLECLWCEALFCVPCLDRHECAASLPDLIRRALKTTKAKPGCQRALRVAIDCMEEHLCYNETIDAYRKIAKLLGVAPKKS